MVQLLLNSQGNFGNTVKCIWVIQARIATQNEKEKSEEEEEEEEKEKEEEEEEEEDTGASGEQ